MADATVSIMLINMLAIGMFVLAVIGAVRPLTNMTWRSAIDRRIDKHVGRARDLTCPVQRDFHEQKATQEEWWLQSLSRFKNHRSVSLASCLIVAAAVGMLVVTFPLVAASTDAKLALPFILLFFIAGLNYVHALHCLSVCSVNRFVFAALRGRDIAPVLRPPSFPAWLVSFRGGLGTSTGLEVLARAAEVQQERGRQWVPDFANSDDAHTYAHRLDDESVREAFELLDDEGALGGASFLISPRS